MRGIALGLMALAAVLAVACGSDAAREATRTPAVTASPSPQASATPAVTPTPPTGGPPVVSAAALASGHLEPREPSPLRRLDGLGLVEEVELDRLVVV